MNSTDFELLYEELYAPKLLPMDLLENLKHENYLEVNFHVENNNTIGITKCTLPNGELTLFKYTFSENKLLLIEQLSNKESHILYNRRESIMEIKSKIIEDMKIKIS